jgi:chemotaxis response regulator CheB
VSSLDFSMPRTAIRIGAVDLVLSIEAIAPKLVKLLGREVK